MRKNVQNVQYAKIRLDYAPGSETTENLMVNVWTGREIPATLNRSRDGKRK